MPEGLLDGLRVVDLAGEPAARAGRILGDLGATVVKVEPPDGDALRSQPLVFEAWQAGKASVVLPEDDPELDELLAAADVVIDTPYWPGAWRLDPGRAPQAVWVSVTPFGLEGPRCQWRATDIGVHAASGNLWATGDPDRPPVRCAEPVAYAHTGPEAAVAALTGLASARAQHVDLSMHEAVLISCMGAAGRYRREQHRGRRAGANIGRTREIWPCKDGWVSFGLRGGKARQATLEAITRLVDQAGLATPALTERDWSTYSHTEATNEELRAIEEPLAAYFAGRTTTELYEIANELNLMLAPINSSREILASPQLEARGMFGRLGGVDRFPLSFAQVRDPDGAVAPVRPSRPAPALGADPLPDWGSGHGSRPYQGAISGENAQGEGAWAGTKILELGAGAAGPIAIRYFAEHGATVVRVESRSRPDFLRVYAYRKDAEHPLEISGMFDALNLDKLSVTLDLKQPAGVELARRLVSWADAVAENFAPKAMRGFGLDYDTLVADKPDLVMVSTCLNGQTGPHRDYPGFGGQGSALSGFNYLTGWPDREPIGPFATITDSLSPRYTAAALAAALLYRRRTGRGVYLDVSQVEAGLWSLSPWLLDCEMNGHVGQRRGNRSDRAAPHGVFPCAGDDRWVAIAVWDDDEWARLAGVLGVADSGWETAAGRLEDVGRLEKVVGAWTSERGPADVAEQLQAVGIEAVPVQDFADVHDDPQLAFRDHFLELEHPIMGPGDYERNGFRLSDAPSGYQHAGPTLGQHNDHVLGEILGLSDAERARYRDEGALG